LDEPAAGLDATASAEMYELIRDLNQQGLTIIMITHDMAASATYATHILHIGNRSALYCGAKDGYAVKGGVFDA
jgi:zinc transport system ATP-binding protein